MVRRGALAKMVNRMWGVDTILMKKLVAGLSVISVFCAFGCGAAFADRQSGLLVTLDALGRRFEARVDDPKSVKYVLRFVEGKAAPEPIKVKLPNGRAMQINARITGVKDCRSGSCVALKGIYAGRTPF